VQSVSSQQPSPELESPIVQSPPTIKTVISIAHSGVSTTSQNSSSNLLTTSPKHNDAPLQSAPSSFRSAGHRCFPRSTSTLRFCYHRLAGLSKPELQPPMCNRCSSPPAHAEPTYSPAPLAVSVNLYPTRDPVAPKLETRQTCLETDSGLA